MENFKKHMTLLLVVCLLTGSALGDVPADCDPEAEVYSPIAKKCILCLNPRMVPKLQPSKCPPRTYYDEIMTCSCVPCEVNTCCPGGDIMNDCPTGSYQPKKGQKTCELAGILTTTWGFKWDPKGVLNTKRNTAQSVVVTKRYTFNKCQNGHVGQSMAVLSGMNLNADNPKISIALSAKSTGTRTTQLTVSKVAMSQIRGYALGTVDACVPPHTVMTMQVVGASKITTASPKSRTVTTSLQCSGSDPQVFAAISELEASGSNGRLSLSVSSFVRLNENDVARTRVSFMTKGPGVVKAAAGTLTYCTSNGRLLAESTIQTGLIDANDIMTKGKKEGLWRRSIKKRITFSTPMQCNNPTVQLGLTKLDVTQNTAVNLELLGATVSKTGFEMLFVLMGGTKATVLEGAYLATCQVGGQAVLNSIKKTCGSLP